ncbi:MAG TPA: CGNR zinc finger domain-containing protein [Streptosporangiaceae bacterium]|nr:CGNR zinc finger domain-containing protein [Streptosporangiaceae bacterium]
MNLAAFADLAVRLVNSAVCGDEADPLRTPEAFREFAANRPFLAVRTTQYDLDRLKLLRTDLATVFTYAVEGAEQAAVDRLNALMMVHPVHPVLVAHDGQPWHVHLDESGSLTDRYAAAAVISLFLLVSQLGIERLGICAIASCDQVFIDGSSNKSRRYCKEHSAARGNVTSLRAPSRNAQGEEDTPVASAAS